MWRLRVADRISCSLGQSGPMNILINIDWPRKPCLSFEAQEFSIEMCLVGSKRIELGRMLHHLVHL
jgi:hypothetical protein